MFFRKKEKSQPLTKEAAEYKRGYQDGYYHGLNQTHSNITAFNNNIDYIKGYEYGYQVGRKEFQNKQININNSNFQTKPNLQNEHSSIDKISGQKNIQNLSNENPNVFRNHFKNKF